MATLASHESDRQSSTRTGWLRRLLKSYYLRRTGSAIVSVFLITTFTFFLIRLMPGNPLDIYIATQMQQGIPRIEAEQMASSLFNVDLHRPIYLQYTDFLGQLAHLDLGKSIVSGGTPVVAIIQKFLPWTLFIVTTSIITSFALGITIGTLMAYRRNNWFDHLFSSLSSIISAIPANILAVLIIVFFGVRWHWFDVTKIRGSLTPGMHPGWSLKFFADALYHASLPIITFVLTTWGGWALSMKSNTVSTMGEDYVTVARARGLSDARIASAYVGRNAVLPLFTSLALSIGFVVGGSTFIENIFVYQGIGQQLGQAVASRDYPVMQGIFLILCSSVVVANYAADLIYSWLDPRIRIEGR